MAPGKSSWLAVCLLLLAGYAAPVRAANANMERVVVAPDSHGFILAKSKRPFHPWGFNYGNRGRLIEDFWNDDWITVAQDFRKARFLGANVLRIHLQFGKFMTAPDHPNRAALDQLSRLLRLSEETGMRLDLTGLACYRAGDTPKWYSAMTNTQERWSAQSNFWTAIAATCADSPAVFCYDLMNEPISPGKRKSGEWMTGHFGDLDFIQFIALDPGARKREDVAVAWIKCLRSAIRAHDTNALITVGLLPWDRTWHNLSGFVPEQVAPELDFICVHIYPDAKQPDDAMEALRKCAVGKPVVIEETFPLSCGVAQEEKFLRDSKSIACGWIGHYDGFTLADYDALERAGKLTLSQGIYQSWERLFVKLKPEFAP